MPPTERFARRDVLRGGLAASITAFLSTTAGAAGAGDWRRLRTQAGTAKFFPDGTPPTPIWGYDGLVPGPEIRLRQGDWLRVEVENDLSQETTVHWHGLRIPNAMDGVPGLTQAPIPPGGTFRYAFQVPDAGTYWYHPHVRGSEQQGRGLYGPLIVEETQPPPVDRDVTWVIDDWRLSDDGTISETFGNPMDLSHAGRIGNLATLNGRDSSTFAVRAGERLRLRIINAANARIFALVFEGHRPWVIALDGQPTAPHPPADNRLVVPPAGRVDVIIDLEGEPGGRYAVMDEAYPRRRYRFLDLVYGEDAPLRDAWPDTVAALAPNPIAEPKPAEAQQHDVVLAGGAMGGMRSAILDGRSMPIRDLARQGKVWAVNGIAAHDTVMEPLFVFQRGRTQLLAIRNETAFPHPMHLHGHSFRLLTLNGRAVRGEPWLDTVLLYPEDRVEVAFVADNPGDWLFHCHVLEHMQAGMSAVVRVTS
ncbi:MAG: multicopper oxidase family protein [Alphaproteobacteria bacterium]|jgi:FtsP/CotA-like multicopper oxidase with cupredoxin domain|nr:multicopper oxidase family protein [Alphaproteobacteria bacterium]MDP6566884.1 multicopper oxidase family protein [Alphaproteobacteria bacterium]